MSYVISNSVSVDECLDKLRELSVKLDLLIPNQSTNPNISLDKIQLGLVYTNNIANRLIQAMNYYNNKSNYRTRG